MPLSSFYDLCSISWYFFQNFGFHFHMQYAKVRGVSLFFNTRTLRHVVVVSLQCKRHGRHDQHTDKLITINETRQNQRSTKRTQVLFLPRENISSPQTPSWVPAARRSLFAREPISCVWLKKGVCVCVCVRLCICVCTLGLAVQLGPRLFCLLRGKGMPKSNMVNKMPRKRHKEKKRIRSEEKDGEW